MMSIKKKHLSYYTGHDYLNIEGLNSIKSIFNERKHIYKKRPVILYRPLFVRFKAD